MSDPKLVDIEVEIVHETEKAWLIDDGKKEVWIPKSVGELDESQPNSTILTLPEKFAIEKELI